MEKISVRGAREHNLRNIDAEMPRNSLTVITGLSGSGKSSLAFDTIYAEGQRRYVESLSAYARQFLELMQKPGGHVDDFNMRFWVAVDCKLPPIVALFWGSIIRYALFDLESQKIP